MGFPNIVRGQDRARTRAGCVRSPCRRADRSHRKPDTGQYAKIPTVRALAAPASTSSLAPSSSHGPVYPGRFRDAWLRQAPESFSHRQRRSVDAPGRTHLALSRRSPLTAIRGCGQGLDLKSKLERSSFNHLRNHDLYMTMIDTMRSHMIMFIHILIFVKHLRASCVICGRPFISINHIGLAAQPASGRGLGRFILKRLPPPTIRYLKPGEFVLVPPASTREHFRFSRIHIMSRPQGGSSPLPLGEAASPDAGEGRTFRLRHRCCKVRPLPLPPMREGINSKGGLAQA